MSRVPHLSARLQGFGTTVFAEMSALAVATGSINLGQGFPDEPGPAAVLDVARAAIGTAHDQYPPGPGQLDLRTAVAEHQQRFTGLGYDPADEVLVTAGATEALTAARSSAGSKVHGPAPSGGGRSGTGRATPPAIAIPAA